MTARRKGTTYRGVKILPCQDVSGSHKGRWFIQSFHKTGMVYSDESSQHAFSLAQAKDIINFWHTLEKE